MNEAIRTRCEWMCEKRAILFSLLPAAVGGSQKCLPAVIKCSSFGKRRALAAALPPRRPTYRTWRCLLWKWNLARNACVRKVKRICQDYGAGRDFFGIWFALLCYLLGGGEEDGNHFAGNIFFTVVVLPVRTFSLHLFGWDYLKKKEMKNIFRSLSTLWEV